MSNGYLYQLGKFKIGLDEETHNHAREALILVFYDHDNKKTIVFTIMIVDFCNLSISCHFPTIMIVEYNSFHNHAHEKV